MFIVSFGFQDSSFMTFIRISFVVLLKCWVLSQCNHHIWFDQIDSFIISLSVYLGVPSRALYLDKFTILATCQTFLFIEVIRCEVCKCLLWKIQEFFKSHVFRKVFDNLLMVQKISKRKTDR